MTNDVVTLPYLLKINNTKIENNKKKISKKYIHNKRNQVIKNNSKKN